MLADLLENPQVLTVDDKDGLVNLPLRTLAYELSIPHLRDLLLQLLVLQLELRVLSKGIVGLPSLAKLLLQGADALNLQIRPVPRLESLVVGPERVGVDLEALEGERALLGQALVLWISQRAQVVVVRGLAAAELRHVLFVE